MSCSPRRAQAIHKVDEAWTQLIDKLGGNWPEAVEQLRVLHRWKQMGAFPQSLGPVTMKRLAELAWLAMSEAALRATDDRNYGDDNEERVPCV